MIVCGSAARIQVTARSISSLEITAQEQIIIAGPLQHTKGKSSCAVT